MDILIKMPIFNDYMVISTPITSNTKDYTIFTYITKEEEDSLSKGQPITITRGDKTLTVNKGSCMFWGSMDFTKDSDDCQTIDKYDLVGAKIKDIIIPANYDYNSHTCKTPQLIGKYLFTTANTSSQVLRYKHGCLNKPERVILFKSKTW